jgi:hypothetical protein
MAQYNHLPIYRTAYQLLVESTETIKEFPREYKYTLGQKLREEIIEIIVLVYRANSAKRKRDFIEELLARLQVAELMIRLSHDMKILSLKRYSALAEKTTSIAKQASGWLKTTGSGVPELIAP